MNIRRLSLMATIGLMVISMSSAMAEMVLDRSKLPEPAESTVWAPPTVETWTTSNGMTVWFLRQDQAPLVSLSLVLGQGAATDSKGKAGLTSLMVDMLDEGAGDRDALTLSEAFQLLATDYSASAATDGLFFEMNMLAENLEPSLALLSDVLLRPQLPEKEFERRKAQRIADALTAEASLGRTAFAVNRKVVFGQGYGAHPTTGFQDTLKRVTLEDVKAHYAALVRPGGAKVVVVGSVTRSSLESALEQSLGGWSGAPSAPEAEVSPKGLEPGIQVIDFPGSAQSFVIMSRRSPGTTAADYFEALVGNRVFAGSFTSRVNLNLREDKGYTYGARGMFSRMIKVGSYAIYAQVKRDVTRASIDEMVKELAASRTDRPLSETEVQDAVSGLLKSFPGRFERMGSVASQLSKAALDERPSDWYRHWPAKVGAVSLDQARKALNTYTALEDFHIIVAGDWQKIGESLKGLNMPIFLYDAQARMLEKIQ